MNLRIRYDDRYQTLTLDTEAAGQLWVSLGLSEEGFTQEEREKLMQEKVEEVYNRPDYNNWHKFIMPQSYTPEFKKKIARLHLGEGRTYKSITAEYGVSKASISKWCSEFSEECRSKADSNSNTPNEVKLMKENLRLRRELEESKKENLFLKKRRHSLQRK